MSAISPTSIRAFPTTDSFESNRTITKSNRLAKIVQKIAITVFITLGILLNPFTDIVTQGLSDFLGLKTLRHGTSIQNYYSIVKFGADPAHGGKEHGSSNGFGVFKPDAANNFMTNSKNHFHVFNDVAWISKELPIIGALFVRVLGPRAHACLSGITQSFVNGIFSLIFSPTLKFRFRAEEIQDKFTEDPSYSGLALKTVHKIDTDRLGLTGIFQQGVQGNVGTRMLQSPGKTLVGLIRLINPIGLALLLSFGIYAAGYMAAGYKAAGYMATSPPLPQETFGDAKSTLSAA